MWRRSKRRPDYRRIAELERELGLDTPTMIARREEQRKNPDWKPERAVDLSHRAPLQGLADMLDFAPGAAWMVSDPGSVQPLFATACSMSAWSPTPKPVSRVVLPSGVNGA